MRIIIEAPQPGDEDVVIVRCSSPDQRLISMLLSFRTANTELTGYLDEKIARLDYRDVYYFEANENRVFAYCNSDVYEVKYKLYELEELFSVICSDLEQIILHDSEYGENRISFAAFQRQAGGASEKRREDSDLPSVCTQSEGKARY